MRRCLILVLLGLAFIVPAAHAQDPSPTLDPVAQAEALQAQADRALSEAQAAAGQASSLRAQAAQADARAAQARSAAQLALAEAERLRLVGALSEAQAAIEQARLAEQQAAQIEVEAAQARALYDEAYMRALGAIANAEEAMKSAGISVANVEALRAQLAAMQSDLRVAEERSRILAIAGAGLFALVALSALAALQIMRHQRRMIIGSVDVAVRSLSRERAQVTEMLMHMLASIGGKDGETIIDHGAPALDGDDLFIRRYADAPEHIVEGLKDLFHD